MIFVIKWSDFYHWTSTFLCYFYFSRLAIVYVFKSNI